MYIAKKCTTSYNYSTLTEYSKKITSDKNCINCSWKMVHWPITFFNQTCVAKS